MWWRMLLLITTVNELAGERKVFGVGENQFDPIGETGCGDVVPADAEHAFWRRRRR